ncbi:polysaccharide export protein EpsE [Polaromonas sp.]|uniref:polysaccharide export protein EpsE n=1 Tax=Polaromonas sp. TaxID=1869339 RepID=UPI0013B6F786|nr:polysaccharide export protein EpsE [Polaromonas sp.]NDP64404.1 polysaccharide export protein EpsE [Polaromonas sp.]
MNNFIRSLVSIFFLIFTLTAFSQSGQPSQAGGASGTAGPQVQQDYRLGAGDSIGVQVYQSPDLSVDARVSETGVISYPLVGTLQLGGLTISEAEKKIADALRTGGFVKLPQVNIVLRQVRGSQVAVLGQVSKPGRFPLETLNTRVSDMLAAAGGTTALGDDVLIVTGQRNSKPFRKVIDIPALFLNDKSENDIVLSGGDTLYVNKAPVFYIYGEAQRPGPYRIERGMTMMQALASGGGPTVRGSQNRLRLHRRDLNGNVVETTPKLTDAIQAEDVIYVRESLF